jgi:hypothetical protein
MQHCFAGCEDSDWHIAALPSEIRFPSMKNGISQGLFQDKDMGMKHFRKYLVVSCFALMMATTGLQASSAKAAEGGDKNVSAVATAPLTGTTKAAPIMSKEPVIKNDKQKTVRRVKRRSGVARADKARAAENTQGERLTINQVMELLKSSRNFSGKNLSGLRLVGFDLTKCNLKGADLSNVNLERADLEEANLELADLSGANMKMTDLRVTGLKGTRLERAILDGAIWQDGMVCARGSIGHCREHTTQIVSKSN